MNNTTYETIDGSMVDNINESLSSLLQHNIKINVNDKTIRQGKLILYTIKDYVITITIRNIKNQLKMYDIYYPYSIYKDRSDIVFDYKLATLFNDHDPLINSLQGFSKDIRNHKLFDQALEFVIV